MGSAVVFRNASVVIRKAILEKYSVFCNAGKIVRVVPDSEEMSVPDDVEIVDAAGSYLVPGFIDMHCHGTRNLLVDGGRSQLEELCEVLPKYGVTAFLPTVCPKSSEKEDLRLLDDLSGTVSEGSTVLGLMLEGHFLALTGAIAGIPRDRSRRRLERLIEAASPLKLAFAISPEVEGVDALIPLMTAQGFPAFITHTAAGADQTEKAIKAGAVHATHFYDVFPYPGDREPGVRGCGAVEAIMAHPEVSVDFIFDGEHVQDIAVKMALACKGRDKVCLVTDANVNAGLPPGRYTGIGSDVIEVAYEGGPARMAPESRNPGTLTGSGLTMDRAVRNAVKLLDGDIPQAIAMASTNPAAVLGMNYRKGSIKEGYDADLVLLDKRLNVTGCWIGGRYRGGK